uniref:BTB domain-containing protein n=1 Tax=Oryzias melastigma TaxID=30732 RepID=A0A3B3CRJ4_ORYME
MASQRTMASSSDTLHFSFPTYGDSILSKMNVLRGERQFCDITLIIGAPKDGLSVHFQAHRVVLAASSDFLRDQFLPLSILSGCRQIIRPLNESKFTFYTTVTWSNSILLLIILNCRFT